MAELTENLLRLKLASGIGNLLLWRLLQHFGGSDSLFGASAAVIASVEGMTLAKAEGLLETAKYDPRPEMDKAVAANINIIPYDDPEYPKPLLHSFDPPAVLYVLGRLRQVDQVALGIVGTRHASPYGRDLALRFSRATSMAGYTIVSGLARGIDTFAHIGALEASGRTVGVLGCGFNHMYPEENRDLALEMSGNGAVVTEFPMATSPSRTTFPARNRIIAGMSLGLLVIEAPLKSGSLITARLANEIGRTVFAVPGRIGDATSEGCNKLIADGAVMVNNVDDILRELNPSQPIKPLTEKKKSRFTGKAPGNLFQQDKPSANASAAFDNDNGSPCHPPPSISPKAWTVSKGKTPPDRQAAPKDIPSHPGLPTPQPTLSPEQVQVLDKVITDWLSVDDIAEHSGLPTNRVIAALAMLKIKRLIEQGAGQTYRRTGGGS